MSLELEAVCFGVGLVAGAVGGFVGNVFLVGIGVAVVALPLLVNTLEVM